MLTQPSRPGATKPRPSPASSPFSVALLARAVRKHWITVVVLAALAVFGAAFHALSEKPLYRVEGRVEFDAHPAQPLGDDVKNVVDVSGGYWNNQEYYATQLEVLRSLHTAEMVVRQLGLQRDAAFIHDARPGETFPAEEIPLDAAATLISSRVSAMLLPKTSIAEVTYVAADPERALRILRTLLDVYVQQNVDSKVESTASAGDWLRGQLTQLQSELQSTERALHDFKLDKNLLSVSLSEQNNMLQREITAYHAELTQTRVELARAEARQKALAAVEDDPDTFPSSDLLNDSALQALRTQYLGAQAELISLKAQNRGENHPEARSATERRDATLKALLAQLRNIRSALDHQVRTLRLQESHLATLVATSKKEALELNLMEIDYNGLLRSKGNTEKLFGIVLERTKASDLTRMLRVNNIRMLDAPRLPTRPYSPNVPAEIAIGAALGLLLGMGGAAGRELLDRSLKTPEDVERELGLSVLGILPEVGPHTPAARPAGSTRRARSQSAHDERSLPPSKPELVVHERATSGAAEAARGIRTNLLFMSPDKPQRVLLVTSPSPFEGKTAVACSLAIAMAQAGHRVLLLDLDLRRARLHKVFDRSNDVGATSLLLEPELLDGMDLSTNVPNLSVLTAGPLPPNPAELLHSAAFAHLLSRLTERYDRVILDSPPLAPVTDANILSTQADATLLVVRAFRTRKDLAQRALRSLHDVSANVVGCVLNSVDLTRSEYRQNYYYYYYREQGGYRSETEKSAEA